MQWQTDAWMSQTPATEFVAGTGVEAASVLMSEKCRGGQNSMNRPNGTESAPVYFMTAFGQQKGVLVSSGFLLPLLSLQLLCLP